MPNESPNKGWIDGSIEALVADMTPAEKVGQMTQASNESIQPSEVAELCIGSVLSGGNGNPTPNTPQVWADMVGGYLNASTETRLGVPILYGVDAVHGHSNVGGATIFPHNIGLGATGDADLVRRIGRATATEMLATGVRWAFAPTVAVPQDIRWGRTYEGYGRDPTLVSAMGAALVEGLHGLEEGPVDVLACAKHFVGDGATSWGSVSRAPWADWWDGWGDTWQIDQGDARISEEELRALHLPPYAAAVASGAMTVMASYSSWNGAKLHAHHSLLTDVLKGELGFEGFVVSDWMAVDQLAPSYEDSVVEAINAGIDMVMVPHDFRRFIDAMTEAIATGRIPVNRIDDAVRRILRAKAAVGLLDGTAGQSPPLQAVGATEHRDLAVEAVRRSAVLLVNEGALPLAPSTSTVAVAGAAADDIGLQCGGWTVGWQGGTGRTTDGVTLLDGLRATGRWHVVYHPDAYFEGQERSDVGLVCLAEPPYAEGLGDRAEPSITDDALELLGRMRERADIVILVVYSGRPLIMPDVVARADAVIAAWLPGSEAGALADLIAGTHPFQGQTSQPWPASVAALDDPDSSPLFPVGHGLVTTREEAGRRYQ